MKEKMLMKLERDRVKAKTEAIEAQMKAMQVSHILRVNGVFFLFTPQHRAKGDAMVVAV